MKILVTNVYSYKNKGDAAIVLALIQEINRVFNKPMIVIQTTDIMNDKDKYGTKISSSLLWILLSSVRNRSLLVRLWVPVSGIMSLSIYAWIFHVLHRKPAFLLSKDLRRFVDDNLEPDIAIACGGGYLRTASSSLSNTLLLSVTCLNFLTAKYLGKPVYLYSQSIGPVHGALQTRILRFALNHIDLIEPRENVSYELLINLNIHTEIVQTADPALLLGDSGTFPTQQIKLKPRRLYVGLTVRKWFDNTQDQGGYMASMSKIVDYLIDNHQAQVFYVPQVIAENFGDDDRLIAKQVWNGVKHRDYFTLIETDMHPFEIIGFCGQMDIFIGTRMHSNIFALINKVPVIAIEYEHKTKGIMQGLGLDELTIPIEEVSFTRLKQKTDSLLNNRQHYRTLIKRNLPAQIRKSRLAIEAVQEAYETRSA